MQSNEEMSDVMDTYGGYLLQLSYMYVKDWTAAEDIVQESFIKFFKTSDQFEGRASLKTYLAKIVIHTSTDYLRSWKARKNLLSNIILHTKDKKSALIEQELLANIQQTELTKHVLHLPLKYREVIVLFYYEQMTSAEIAQITGISENTVKTRLRRGREQLRARLNEEDWEVFRYE